MAFRKGENEAGWLAIVGFPEVLRLKEGASSSQVARTLSERTGLHITKNMVLGVLSRRKPYVPKPPPPPPPPPPLHDMSNPHDCAYPFGNPGAADFRFCHEPLKQIGAPYCAAHMRVAYMPVPPRPVRI